MSINFKQQELVDESINEYITTYDKLALQYLGVRKQILVLASEIGESPTGVEAVKIEKLRFELDTIWQAYSSHLDVIEKTLEVSKDVSVGYMDELNGKYEQLLVKKLTVMKHLKNIKDVQVPLIERIRHLDSSFKNSVNRTSAKRINKDQVKKELNLKSNNTVDPNMLVFTKSQLDSLFKEFDEEVKDLKTVYDIEGETGKSRPIKASYYLDRELEVSEKFIPVDDQYLFKVAGVTYQDSYLARASISQFDTLNDQLTKEIIDLIKNTTAARQKWHKNAKKIEQFKEIIEEDINMEDA